MARYDGFRDGTLNLDAMYRRDMLDSWYNTPRPEPQLGSVVIGSTEYRYKPGWQMDYLWNDIAQCGNLSLAWTAPDSYHPERTTNVMAYSAINPKLDITGQVYEAIKLAEMHELAEFFVVDGKRPFDPHR